MGKGLSFSEILAAVRAVNPDESRKYHVIAARYYVGAIDCAELRFMGHRRHLGVYDSTLPPLLEPEQIEKIIRDR